MITIYLKDFVLSGQFGPVKLGMNRGEVVQVLGQPDDIIDFDTGSCSLMYGWYEFFYFKDTEKIIGIQNDHLTTWPNHKTLDKIINQHRNDIYFENTIFKIDLWFLKIGKDITRKEVKMILNQEAIAYKEIKDGFGNDILEFESGVTMDFDDNSGNFVSREPDKPLITNLDDQLLAGIRQFKL